MKKPVKERYSLPTVSIVMNCHNGAAFLRNALNSIINQNFQDWELVFWDNGSTDASAKIFKSYRDRRFKYFYTSSKVKLYEARARAAAKCTGKFLAFLDTDDEWYPHNLNHQLASFNAAGVGLSFGNYHIETYSNGDLKSRETAIKDTINIVSVETLLKKYNVAISFLMIRKDLYDLEDLQFNPSYNIIGDFDLVIRLAVRADVNYVGTPIGMYRWHGRNESINGEAQHVAELKAWASSLKRNSPLRHNREFKTLENTIKYKEIILFLANKNKIEAFKHWSKLPLGVLKVRAFLGLLTPSKYFFLLRK